MALSYDNRETCSAIIPSGCIAYTGQVDESIADLLPNCRPNINDIFGAHQTQINAINQVLGDIPGATNGCSLTMPEPITQAGLNQLFLNTLCTIKASVAAIDTEVDPTTLMIAINLLCLIDPSCDPATEYSLQEILVKLVTAYCNLLTRVTTIETTLNI